MIAPPRLTAMRRLSSLLMQEFAKLSPQALLAVMDELSQKAKASSLPPEILDMLLAAE